MVSRIKLSACGLFLLAAELAASVAGADTRLFSVRADKPGTTVTEAFVGSGHKLTVAGAGGGVTFFRLDSPKGPVACQQHFVFVASTGERQTGDFDLCALNWQVPLHLSGGPVEAEQRSTPPEPSRAPQPDEGITSSINPQRSPDAAVVMASTHPLTVTADDPTVRIESVSLDGQMARIESRAGNGVEISVPGGPGRIPCQHDIGLKLSDGRMITRGANICEHNWSVLVTLAGDSAPKLADAGPRAVAPPAVSPVPPADMAPSPTSNPAPEAGAGPPAAVAPPAVASAPPPEGDKEPSPVPAPAPEADAGPPAAVAPPAIAPAPPAEGDKVPSPRLNPAPTEPVPAPLANAPSPPNPPPPAEAAPASEVWSFVRRPSAVLLDYGDPKDTPEFAANCRPASGQIAVRVFQRSPGARVDGPQPVAMRVGSFLHAYYSVSAPVPAGAKGVRFEFRTSSADALWQGLAHERELAIKIGSAAANSIPLEGSGSPLRQFLAACGGQRTAPLVAGRAAGPAAAPSTAGLSASQGLSYQCRDGSSLRIQFDSRQGTAAVLEPGAPPAVLNRVPTARGPDAARYAAGPAVLVGRGEFIRWSRSGEPPRVCRPRVPAGLR